VSGQIPINDFANFAAVVSASSIDIAAIAVPARVAASVLDAVVEAGIKGVLNFAPIRLRAPAGVKIKHVDLLVSLESLSYFLARGASLAKLDDDTDPTSI